MATTSVVKRLLGLALLLAAVAGSGFYMFREARTEGVCTVCHRDIHQQTLYRIHLADGRMQQVCCPRCGLRYQRGRDDVVGIEVADFETGELFDAHQAFFVENNTVAFCRGDRVKKDYSGSRYELSWDRCLPSLAAFKMLPAAKALREQVGGTIKTYEEIAAEGS